MLLDPFAFFPGMASAIAGLGGPMAHEQDRSYALHTLYVDVAEGPASFIVRFAGLTARRGSLQLRVHMLGEDQRAVLVNTARIQLNRLVAMGGETSIRFEGYRNVRFALYGTIVGETDAAADGLMVTLDRPAAIEEPVDVVIEARNTAFRRDDVRPDTQLLSMAAPTLASPVSQAGTAGQLEEPCLDRWVGELGLRDAPARRQWSEAYVLQALDRYGALQKGARGLVFEPADRSVTKALRKLGIEVVTAPLPPSPDVIARELVNFDFLWTIDIAQRFGSLSIGRWFIDAAFRCIRPGGLAVHVVPFDPAADQRLPSASDLLFGRPELERTALGMISREHEVAQIKINTVDAITGPVPDSDVEAACFGIIARKARLPN
jgi:hypothetical protein